MSAAGGAGLPATQLAYRESQKGHAEAGCRGLTIVPACMRTTSAPEQVGGGGGGGGGGGSSKRDESEIAVAWRQHPFRMVRCPGGEIYRLPVDGRAKDSGVSGRARS